MKWGILMHLKLGEPQSIGANYTFSYHTATRVGRVEDSREDDEFWRLMCMKLLLKTRWKNRASSLPISLEVLLTSMVSWPPPRTICSKMGWWRQSWPAALCGTASTAPCFPCPTVWPCCPEKEIKKQMKPSSWWERMPYKLFCPSAKVNRKKNVEKCKMYSLSRK